MDPYKILSLDPNSTIEEVNRAYFYIAKIYHPNKGGNEEEFLRFQQAYKQIIETHANAQKLTVAPKDFNQLRNQDQIDIQHQFKPEDFRNSMQNRFSEELFNRRFREQRTDSGGVSDDNAYTYDIDGLDMSDRKADEYKREYAQVTAEVESVIPFGNGRFNNATFNQAFIHLKEREKEERVKRGEVEEVGLPNPTASREVMACTNIENPRNPGTGDFAGLQQAYGANHQNPNGYDPKFLAQFQGQTDITKVNTLSANEMRKRVNDWQNIKLQYNKEKLVTDLTVPLKEVEGLESNKAARQMQHQRMMLQEQARVEAEAQARAQIAGSSSNRGTGTGPGTDMFARMTALRAPIHVQAMSGLGPDRPVASNSKGTNRETAGYVTQPAAILLQQPTQINRYRGRPPPIQKKHQHVHVKKVHEPNQSNIEDELRQMRRALRRQQKVIKQLSRRLD
jgi:curved DNA-binding protein CbpA